MWIQSDSNFVVNRMLTQIGSAFSVRSGVQKRKCAVFECKCGNRLVMRVETVKSSENVACGCKLIARAKQGIPKHGMSSSKVYRRWAGMIQRCTNANSKNYKRYGARGITVCDEWKMSFAAFLDDMGQMPFHNAQIDRIDPHGGYCRENCRWVTHKQNQRNRKSHALVEYQGRKMPVAEFAELIGVRDSTVRSRMHAGWSVEQIAGIPVGGKRNG